MALVLGAGIIHCYGNSSITYNGTFLPYGITEPRLHFTDEDAVSPPCSPRISETDEVRPRLLFHYPDRQWLNLGYYVYSNRDFADCVSSHNKFPKKNRKNKNMTRYFRKQGKLKQPGGASCNQRR